MTKQLVTYDSGIIIEFARRLYRQAASIMYTYTIVGTFFGSISSGILFSNMRMNNDLTPILGILGASILFGLVGFLIAQERAFKLRLMAQNALCQVQIEKNTSELLTK